MAYLLHQTQFFTTVNHLRDLPPTAQPEVAFAGRSNAGKSTAINVLCNQKRLAFASKTPGRTQHINYFSIGSEKNTEGFLVDLPGYGYAEVPESAKLHWQKLLSNYMQSRTQLVGLVLLMDARRPFTELDQAMVEWFLPTEKPIHILLTKSDKLTRQESTLTLRKTEQFIEQNIAPDAQKNVSVQLFSSLKRTGLETAHQMIESWIKKPATSI